MTRWALALGLLLAPGCVYVSKAEFDEHWDEDGDGWPLGEDCAETDDQQYPFAPDVRGDGCDSDCGTEQDSDGDDWPDDSDCAPDDPAVFPCADDAPGDELDSDCDGSPEPRSDACPTADPDYPDVATVTCSAGGT